MTLTTVNKIMNGIVNNKQFLFIRPTAQDLFTHIVSVPNSVTVTIKVYNCANDDGLFDGQIGFRIDSVHQCKFD